jgi:integrase/recombinase XerC
MGLISKNSLILVSGLDEFQSYMKRWLVACKSNGLSEKSTTEYERVMNRFHWWFTDYSKTADKVGYHPSNITTQELRQFIAYLRDDQPIGRWGLPIAAKSSGGDNGSKAALSAITVKHYGTVVKAFFNWLESDDIIEKNPFTRAIKLANKRQEARTVKTVDRENLAKLFEAMETPHRLRKYAGCRNLAIISFLLDTGVRRGELLSIKIEDLDKDKRRCRVTGKSGERYVFYSDITNKHLARYLDEFRNGQAKNQNLELWLTEDGYPIGYSTISSLVIRLEKSTGVKFHAHQLRHSFATAMANQGVNVFDLKAMLGHATITTTQIYVNSNPDMLQKAYQDKSPMITMELGKRRPGRPRRT